MPNAEVVITEDGEMYLIVDGVKIAKRQDRKWVSLEPGYHVYQDKDEIIIGYKSAERRAQ
jgi:hypothetical protein